MKKIGSFYQNVRIQPQSIKNWEKGNIPAADTAIKMAEYLKVPVRDYSIFLRKKWLEKSGENVYILLMGNFIKGMNTIGQLNPAPISFNNYPPRNSAWNGVVNSFRQTGNNILSAIKENVNAKRESKQAT